MVNKNSMEIASKMSIGGSVRYQLLATIIVNLCSLLYGYEAGWTSSSLLIFESDSTSPLSQGALDKEERSWITSLFAISGVFGTIFYYLTADFFGRKFSLCSIAIPHVISWILIDLSTKPWHLYVSRVLSGLASGGGFTLVPVFVSEISEPHVRGRLGSLLMLTANLGFLIAFVAGNYLTYFQVPYFGIVTSVIFFVGFIFFPETPVFLLRKQREEEAEKSFRFYRNVSHSELLSDDHRYEWDTMKTQNLIASNESIGDCVDWRVLYSTRSGRKAILIGMVMIGMHELCGCFTMLNYTATIFRESGSDISPQLSAIIVGVIQLLGTYVASFLVDKAGRKILLVFSAVGTAMCLLMLGAYSYANSVGVDVKPFSWLSIASFSGMMFLAACGIIPLMFVVISEVMPEKVRSIGCTICFCMSWILAFVMVKFFESVAEIFGMHGWVFFFAGCTLTGTLFIIFCIPETKGKTYAEIAALLERR